MMNTPVSDRSLSANSDRHANPWLWLGFGAVLAAAVFCWWGTFSAPFALDDQESIVTNGTLRDLRSFAWVTPPSTGGETVSGRPVLNLSFALNYAVGGLDVRGYHVTNLLIHLLTALLLYEVLRRSFSSANDTLRAGAIRLGEGAALAVTALWTLHPLTTAAVTYVAQRAESLSSLFLLGTLYAFIRSTSSKTPWAWLVLSLVSCLLGIGTKETVFAAPLLVLLYDRTFVSGSWSVAWRAHRWRHLSLFLTWLPLAALILSNHGRGGSAGFAGLESSWHYLLTQAQALGLYLRLAFWPAAQVFDYGVPLVTGVSAVWPQLLLAAALLGGLLWLLVRGHPAGFWGACCVLVLAPSSSLVPVATQTMAEHRLYLPLAALIALLVLLLRPFLARFRPWQLSALVSVVVTALAITTFVRNGVYQSELTLWRDTVLKRPDNARAHNNLGLALMAAGRRGEAADEFRSTLALQPNHAFAHFNLAVLLEGEGRFEEAVLHLRQALAADPEYVSARVNLGHLLARLGHTDEAIANYEVALAADALAQDARTNLAALLLDKGKVAQSISLLRAVLSAEPQLPEAHYHLGRALEKTGAQAAAAEAEYREAVRLRPGFAPAHLALGNCLAAGGSDALAEACFLEAIRRDARYAEPHFALGNLHARAERFERAIAEYQAALALEPSHVQALNNLGNCFLVTGRAAEAVFTYEAVLRLRPDAAGVGENLACARELLRSGGSSAQ